MLARVGLSNQGRGRLRPRRLWPHVRQRRARRRQGRNGRCTTKKAPGKLADAFKSFRAYLSMTHSAMRDMRVTSSLGLTKVFGTVLVPGHDFHLRSGAVASLHLPVRTGRNGMWTWGQEFSSIFFSSRAAARLTSFSTPEGSFPRRRASSRALYPALMKPVRISRSESERALKEASCSLVR